MILDRLILEGAGGVLHAKAVVADDEAVFVTSANLTEAALDRNIELGVLIRDRAFALTIGGYFPQFDRPRSTQAFTICHEKRLFHDFTADGRSKINADRRTRLVSNWLRHSCGTLKALVVALGVVTQRSLRRLLPAPRRAYRRRPHPFPGPPGGEEEGGHDQTDLHLTELQ